MTRPFFKLDIVSSLAWKRKPPWSHGYKEMRSANSLREVGADPSPVESLMTKCACSVTQLCLTHCDHMDGCPLGPSVLGTFQARMPEWVAISCSRGNLPDPRIEPMSLESPALAGGFFATAPPEKPLWWQCSPDNGSTVTLWAPVPRTQPSPPQTPDPQKLWGNKSCIVFIKFVLISCKPRKLSCLLYRICNCLCKKGRNDIYACMFKFFIKKHQKDKQEIYKNNCPQNEEEMQVSRAGSRTFQATPFCTVWIFKSPNVWSI